MAANRFLSNALIKLRLVDSMGSPLWKSAGVFLLHEVVKDR